MTTTAETERALISALDTIRPTYAIPLDPGTCANVTHSQRWLSRVAPASGGCIEWVGRRNDKGYGTIWIKTRHRLVHRVSYVARTGEDIPAGFVLDHLCRNPACVNPDHLEAVSQRVNVLRGMAPVARQAAQSTCLRGHELELRTTGRRWCPTCAREGRRRRRVIVNEARRILGLTQVQYFNLHGQSVSAAEAIIAANGDTK